MEYITVSAKTLDDAITEALIQLGVQAISWIMKLLKKAVQASLV